MAGAGDGGGEVGVGEDDVRGLAAEFEREPLQVAGRRPDDGLPGCDRTGEGDLVDVGMGSQRCSGLGAAGDDVDDPRRDPRFEAEFAEPQRAERRLLGRLQDERAPGGEDRPELPDGGGDRPVPGDDAADDADGLPQRVAQDLPRERVRDGVAGQRDGLRGVPVQQAHRPPGEAGPGPRRAHVERVEEAQLVEVGLHEVGQAHQGTLPVVGRPAAPLPVEGAAGGRHRPVDVVGRRVGHGGQGLAGRRVHGVERAPGAGLDGFTVDEEPLGPTVEEGRPGTAGGAHHTPSERPMISFMISVVPP